MNEALVQQFISQTEQADARHVESQRAFASGSFGEYWERMGREAMERMEGETNGDETSGSSTAGGNSEAGGGSGGGTGRSGQSGGPVESPGDAAGPRTKSA